MKNILCTILVASLSMSPVMAAPKTVRENVIALSDIGMGYGETKVKGKTAEEIFKNFLAKNGDGEELVYKEIKDMDFGDEVDEGFTSVQSAKEMSGFIESVIEEKIEGLDKVDDAKKILELKGQIYDLNRGWAQLIKNLDRQGVKFGYTGWGPGYCGVSFIELIIIDVKEQKVYELYLSEGGSC